MPKKMAIVLSFILPFVSVKELLAQDNDSSQLSKMQRQIELLVKQVDSLSSKVEEQNKVIEDLKGARLTATEPSVTENKDAVTAVQPVSAKAVLPYLPDIGVVADIVGTSTESGEDEEGNDRLSVRELEFVFGHDIDPYSRFDSTITFSDFEDPEIEEAYVSYWNLPADSTAKIGRMRQKIGKASAMHRDSLDTVDEPLVVQSYFGVEGLFRTGLELSGFTPLSLDEYTQQLTLGVMEGGVGEGGQAFGDTTRRPTFYGHLANFWEISESNNFELGGTYMLGSSEDNSSFDVDVFGVDATYIHHINPVNRLKIQSEAYFQSRSNPIYETDDGTELPSNSDPFGMYALIDYRLSQRWGAGFRYDYVQLTADEPDSDNRDEAYSTYLTFYQSEFARWRLQYQYADLYDDTNDNRFFLQGTFAIGVHKHELQ